MFVNVVFNNNTFLLPLHIAHNLMAEQLLAIHVDRIYLLFANKDAGGILSTGLGNLVPTE
jgi:hypothetical protein